jgi:hypothetical protein
MRSLFVVCIALFAMACSQSFTDSRGLTYSAGSATSSDSLTTTVTIRNGGSHTAGLTLGGSCPVTIMVYAGAAGGTQTAVWDQGAWRAQTGVSCSSTPQLVSISRGESREYSTSVAVTDVLGDSLAAGSYSFVARIAFQLGGLDVPAGEGELGTGD